MTCRVGFRVGPAVEMSVLGPIGSSTALSEGLEFGFFVGLSATLSEGLDVRVFSTVPPCEENDMSSDLWKNANHAHWQLPFSPVLGRTPY